MEWRSVLEGSHRILLGYSFITGVRFQLSRMRSVKFRSEGKAKNHMFSEHFLFSFFDFKDATDYFNS